MYRSPSDDAFVSILVCRDLLDYVYCYHFQKTGNADFQGPHQTRKSAGQLLIHYCNLFKPTFRKIYSKTFPSMCTDQLAFARYVITNCENFLVNLPFYGFLVSSAFIADLCLFCFENRCYRYINTGSVCMYLVMCRIVTKWCARDIHSWIACMWDFCAEVNMYVTRFKALVASSVDKSLGDSVRAKRTTSLERLYLRRFIDEIEGRMILEFLHDGDSLKASEVLLIKTTEFLEESQPNVSTRNTDACTICNTQCMFYYKMYVMTRNQSTF